ncbi:putative ubiquitin-protein ligase E3A [Triangularia verruculosa]|uniref:HECT-type E3 ubiquitin transferase n=1 Tax=Triangularia verruculosa TaxID=2587418 RepID=A0AAN6XC19_9PEZI|nr:putative ubiquitin-protein ligase E3A [Triangularia verruculosa]
MTRDTMRPAAGSSQSYTNADDLDILAGLWEEAPFARLPCDAPTELKDLLEDIDNPKRVYAIHKASRRHNFQQVVQRYVVQLREGCGVEHCVTPTCFACRKRAAGQAPIKRYNTTSARTLATYLASQDNPENGLCPNLRTPKAPPAALGSLVFVPKQRLHNDRAPVASPKSQVNNSRPVSPRTNGRPVASARERGRSTNSLRDTDSPKPKRQPGFEAVEEPVSKDHRSFAANVFGTVAFKMLEWLTPAALEDMSRRTKAFQEELSPDRRDPEPAKVEANRHKGEEPRTRAASVQPNGTLANGRLLPKNKPSGKDQDPKDDHHSRDPPPVSRSTHPRRNSNAKLRTANPPVPKRQLSIDPYTQDPLVDDPYPGLLRSPRGNAGSADRGPRGPKPTGSALSRPISQLSSAGYFDHVALEKMPPPKALDLKNYLGRNQLDGTRTSDTSGPRQLGVPSGSSSDRSCSSGSAEVVHPEPESDEESVLPQTLSTLNADVVDFICDVMQDDGTAEKHMLEPLSITRFHNGHRGRSKVLKRKKLASGCPNFTLEWKLFIEQTLFNILSDPRLVVQSFTKQGQLYDSHTLWYCMLRMTRVAPSLVFHSLWMAAGSLFAPPESLLAPRSPTAKLFRDKESLSNAEAGRLMSICLHALIATAPLITPDPSDPEKATQQLYDMSRIRSHGLSLAQSGAVANQPADLCLQYEDAFTDDLALRLARRLFTAINTRRCFDVLCEQNKALDGDEKAAETDVLAPLFSQLNFLHADAVYYVLDFSFNERALHETRVPILLLDWARAVMLNDWNGSPVIKGDGSFGGALALMQAMYNKRHELLLGDAQFRSEYFAERLDTVQMPIAWLSHLSTRQKVHLLDYPFIFNPSTLVTYFRSINFSRMSRSYEESTSLQDRIDVIASRSSLTRHHKEVLTERLRAAATKYLVLDIRREAVIEDAFNQLWRREERELLRPLKVRLGESTGEEGFDLGGVQQEFFRLALAEALNPDYGAFTVDERSRMTWFVPGSLEDEWKFELIGLLVSLAVYNGLTLPVTFPKALYRKLLDKPVDKLGHIADGWPDIASSLTEIEQWDDSGPKGKLEDLCITYDFSTSAFGQHVIREMKPSASGEGDNSDWDRSPSEEWPQFSKTAAHASYYPAPHEDNPEEESKPVTIHNRDEYISDYIRYLTTVSVRPQYEAFARGFRTCLQPKSLSLLTPSLLQSLVEGVQEIDISELKRYAKYTGYDEHHRTIRDFWSIVKRYDEDMKRKLLEFVTASDRVPVGGMKYVVFNIQKNGVENDEVGGGNRGRLPTSYTCYSTLLLPEYKDKETLRERLGMALENARGFGFA